MAFLDKIKNVLGYTKFPTEAEALFSLARKHECSEYDLFVRAAERWNIPMVFVSRDFKRYLATQQITHYLRDYLRSEFEQEADHQELNEILAALFRWLDKLAGRGKQGR